ncbi:MAG: CDP-diacylglycerol--serine O-phosphatidyltransferase [Candidatus Omnitrophica bacterium]|nr:CDP-diacylglycerol--serine O-phosphatidyltransferase [Candidatus Omnitrophota bacterium]
MHYQFIANIVTILSLIFGFSSIFLALNLKYSMASWFIIWAVLCDIIDGKIARLSPTPSEFGKEFDSLADMVSFGVAPAVLVYMLAFGNQFNIQNIFVVCLYLSCGAFRLARFNIYSKGRPRGYFKGLPITASGAFLASFVLWAHRFDIGVRQEIFWLVLLILSLLMGSNIRYPNFSNFKAARGFIGVSLLLLSIIAALMSKGVALLIIFFTYVALSPIIVGDKDTPIQIGNA